MNVTIELRHDKDFVRKCHIEDHLMTLDRYERQKQTCGDFMAMSSIRSILNSIKEQLPA